MSSRSPGDAWCGIEPTWIIPYFNAEKHHGNGALSLSLPPSSKLAGWSKGKLEDQVWSFQALLLTTRRCSIIIFHLPEGEGKRCLPAQVTTMALAITERSQGTEIRWRLLPRLVQSQPSLTFLPLALRCLVGPRVQLRVPPWLPAQIDSDPLAGQWFSPILPQSRWRSWSICTGAEVEDIASVKDCFLWNGMVNFPFIQPNEIPCFRP